jgi:Flp pilus assembly protein TadB
MDIHFSLQIVLLALLAGLGIFTIVASFAVPLQSVTRKILEEETGPRIAGIAEGNILRAMLIDISRKAKPEGGDLEEKLRRSGGFYKSVADFHARRMMSAFVYMILGVVIAAGMGVALDISLGVVGISLFATLMALFGFLMPNRALNSAIDKRRERLKKEMGFGLDRISLLLQSGASLMESLAHTGSMGIFGDACERIAAQASTGRPISEINRCVRDDLPETPEFDEFLQMVRIGMQKGQEMIKPFRERAQIMRGRLKLDIIEAGHSAKIKVTLLTSGFILIASMIVTLGPVMILLTQQGLF